MSTNRNSVAHEQRSRTDTLIRSLHTPARTPKPELGNRLFFDDNQLATLLERSGKSGSAWRGDDDPLANFNLLLRDDSTGGNQAEERACLCLSICYRHLLCVTGLAASLSPQRLCRAATAHRTLKSGKYCRTTFKTVVRYRLTKCSRRDDMVHIGILRGAADDPPKRVMEHAEAAAPREIAGLSTATLCRKRARQCALAHID